MTVFEAYITNLGKYAEGQLVGETLKFPATTEEVQALLKRIGVDGVRYEEIFITSFDGDVLGLYDHLGEYESIDELNHLAHVLSDLDQSDIEKFEAVIDSGEYTGSVHDLINLAQNMDCYDFYPGIVESNFTGKQLLHGKIDVRPDIDRVDPLLRAGAVRGLSGDKDTEGIAGRHRRARAHGDRTDRVARGHMTGVGDVRPGRAQKTCFDHGCRTLEGFLAGLKKQAYRAAQRRLIFLEHFGRR